MRLTAVRYNLVFVVVVFLCYHLFTLDVEKGDSIVIIVLQSYHFFLHAILESISVILLLRNSLSATVTRLFCITECFITHLTTS